jgi:hypothetical protein
MLDGRSNGQEPAGSAGPKWRAKHYRSYTTWNVGTGITKSVFTLDQRYYDSDLHKGDCNAFTSDHTARFTGAFTPINPGGFGSNWCGATFVATGKFDLTAMTNVKYDIAHLWRSLAGRRPVAKSAPARREHLGNDTPLRHKIPRNASAGGGEQAVGFTAPVILGAEINVEAQLFIELEAHPDVDE